MGKNKSLDEILCDITVELISRGFTMEYLSSLTLTGIFLCYHISMKQKTRDVSALLNIIATGSQADGKEINKVNKEISVYG